MPSFYDIKQFTHTHILNQWHQSWSTLHTKFNEITSTILSWPTFTLSRRQEVITNRLWKGHTWLTHKHLMTTHGEILTVKHIIFYCRIYRDIRSNVQIADNLHEALGPDPANIEKCWNRYFKSTNLHNLLWYCTNSKYFKPFFYFSISKANNQCCCDPSKCKKNYFGAHKKTVPLSILHYGVQVDNIMYIILKYFYHTADRSYTWFHIIVGIR